MMRVRFPLAAVILMTLLPGCDLFSVAEGQSYSTFPVNSDLGHPYAIQVQIPATEPLGTVYVLDGDSNFAKVVAITKQLSAQGLMSPVAVVGIGYGSGSNERTRDYTPTVSDDEGGGSAEFLTFLKTVLVPEVENRFPQLPKDPQRRVLTGHSFGGLAVITELLRDEGVFGSLHASSPSLWYDGCTVFSTLDAWKSGAGPLIPQRFSMTMGGQEGDGMPLLFQVFGTRLSGLFPDQLSQRSELFPGLRHSETYLESLKTTLTAWGKF